MFKVYWTERSITDSLAPCEVFDPRSQDFATDKMTDALKFMEELRKEPNNSFISMCSENPNSVGKAGVDEVGPDYNWTKRRGNMPRYKE